jgi:iron complex transport system permease protein
MSPRRSLSLLIGLLPTALLLIILPSVGSEWISPLHWFKSGDGDLERSLLLELRLPRVLLGFVAGAALAYCGVIFQALFRNPLASPFTLGVSGGAAVGATLSLFISAPFTILSVRSSAVFSMLGALITAGLIATVAASRQVTGTTIILFGVVLSFISSSIILLLQHLGSLADLYRMTRWMLGSLEIVGFSEFYAVIPLVFIGLALSLPDRAGLNLISLGDELALSRGVSVRAVRIRALLAVSFIIGGVVSICGPIGFIGIIIPFFCRQVAGYDNRKVAPLSILVGGIFLVLCDALSRCISFPAELPVGVWTALVGGPVFLGILMRRGQALKDTVI